MTGAGPAVRWLVTGVVLSLGLGPRDRLVCDHRAVPLAVRGDCDTAAGVSASLSCPLRTLRLCRSELLSASAPPLSRARGGRRERGLSAGDGWRGLTRPDRPDGSSGRPPCRSARPSPATPRPARPQGRWRGRWHGRRSRPPGSRRSASSAWPTSTKMRSPRSIVRSYSASWSRSQRPGQRLRHLDSEAGGNASGGTGEAVLDLPEAPLFRGLGVPQPAIDDR
jgi:hypothetical protein